MKRVVALLLAVFLLTGCRGGSGGMERALSLRDRLLKSNGCSFQAVITADYGSALYTFSMACQADSQGNVSFTVTEPQTISGITGIISQQGGKLTFDGQALAFETLADGQITPVCAPWLLIHTLRSGYLSSCGQDEDGLRLGIDDSYQDDALHLDIWLCKNDLPVRGEILWQGRRVVSLEVRNFLYV